LFGFDIGHRSYVPTFLCLLPLELGTPVASVQRGCTEGLLPAALHGPLANRLAPCSNSYTADFVERK